MNDQWNQNPGGQQTPAADPNAAQQPVGGGWTPPTPNPAGGGDPAQTPSQNWTPEPPVQTPTPEPTPTPAPTPEPDNGGGSPASDPGTGAPMGGWNQGDSSGTNQGGAV